MSKLLKLLANGIRWRIEKEGIPKEYFSEFHGKDLSPFLSGLLKDRGPTGNPTLARVEELAEALDIEPETVFLNEKESELLRLFRKRPELQDSILQTLGFIPVANELKPWHRRQRKD